MLREYNQELEQLEFNNQTGNSYLDSLNDKINSLTRQIDQEMEQKMFSSEPQDQKLSLFRQNVSSFLFKLILKFNLSKADLILSTSNIIALETKNYTKKDIIITPFGVDTDKFKIKKNKNKNEKIIILYRFIC